MSPFTSCLKSAKKDFYQKKICAAFDTRKLLNFLLPLSTTLPSTALTPDMFASLFTENVATINNQFSDPDQHSQSKPVSGVSFCYFAERGWGLQTSPELKTYNLLNPIPLN